MAADAARGPAAAVEQELAAAEAALRDREWAKAESRYRSALLDAWLLLGDIESVEGRIAEAKEAYGHALRSAVETRRPWRALALAHMQLGEPREAVALLTRLVAASPKEATARRLLAQALIADGQPQQAVQELEEARNALPDDLEITFALGTGHLRVGNVEAAERLFDELVRRRPGAAVYVLIGRMYRDFRHHERARAALKTAIKLDPRVPRAHYYLGTIAALAEGISGLEESITEFREELKRIPDDPLTNQHLGIALVEARRPEEALPALEKALRASWATADVFHYHGRCLVALDRPVEALASLRRALELAEAETPVDAGQVGTIHYQIALTLRKTGSAAEAEPHFARAEALSAQNTMTARERLARFLSDATQPEDLHATRSVLLPLVESSPVTALGDAERAALKSGLRDAAARAYLNLGVMHAQAQRFDRAAELFESAAATAPELPNIHFAWGSALFNAKNYDAALAPLLRAAEAAPSDAGRRRMLAMAYLNAGTYDRAADILGNDPDRERDPQIQFAYGLALMRSGRTAQGQAAFQRLLARHGDSAEVSVVLGQAHAQEEDYEAAERRLAQALALNPKVAEANGTLGVIYLKRGRLAEAEKALRAELALNADDFKSRHHLAAVLEMTGRSTEAVPLLRAVLKGQPSYHEARYLLGKVLLAQGAAQEAAEHLEAAVRQAPGEASTRYQLAQAYQKLGRVEQARAHFDEYQRLKDKRREVQP